MDSEILSVMFMDSYELRNDAYWICCPNRLGRQS